jgi:hypothetical protein
MTFEISYHIITAALISFRPCDVFAVVPISKYLLRLASASLLQIITDLRERRAAGDRRCGNQCSCREAPKPLDGVLFLYSPAKVGGLLEERHRTGRNFASMNEREVTEICQRYGWAIVGPLPL